MWVATRSGRTVCGVVAAGRLVADGDPMLTGAEPGLFVRVVDDGDTVEEATAEPGRRRTTRRTAG
jgi:hypothetical protein